MIIEGLHRQAKGWEVVEAYSRDCGAGDMPIVMRAIKADVQESTQQEDKASKFKKTITREGGENSSEEEIEYKPVRQKVGKGELMFLNM
jgi:hypothetical protein